MIATREQMPERDEIELLLPWHAAGTLSRADSERVERALERDPVLADRFELVREELGETIHFNESLGAPSARAADRLFAAIDAEPARRAQPAASGLASLVAGFFGQFSPRALAWSTAAVLAIVVQAGLLAGVYFKERKGSTYETASFNNGAPAQKGSFVLIRFKADATAGGITKFLEANKAALVDGPRAGGLYRVRVAPTALAPEDLKQIVTRLGQDSDVVATVLPVQ